MPKKNAKKDKIKIDDTDYFLEDLSDNAKNQILNLKFVDDQLLQLQNEWAIADTARISYSAALKREIKKEKTTEK